MAANAFPARKRLAEYEVRVVLREGRRVTGPMLDLKYAGRCVQHHVGGARLAISVPKRLLKRAVARNAVKRLIRECFRVHQIAMAEQDLLITYKSTVSAKQRRERRALRAQLQGLFAEVLRRSGARLMPETPA